MLALLQEVLMFLTSGDKKINRLNLFCALFYTPWFLQSSKPEKAPTNDLMAYKAMKEFAKHDQLVAEEVSKIIRRHGWYLSEKLVIVALVDEDLEDHLRQKVATKLQASSVPESFSSGYPDMPEFSSLDNISDAVGPDS